jgi:hypothetical protein
MLQVFELRISLFYKASRDDFKSNIFYSLCYNRCPTTCLKKFNMNFIFYGYSHPSWRKIPASRKKRNLLFSSCIIGPNISISKEGSCRAVVIALLSLAMEMIKFSIILIKLRKDFVTLDGVMRYFLD